MSNILWKNFYLCLSKLKCFPTCLPPPLPPPSQEEKNDTTTLYPPIPLPRKTFNNNNNPLSEPTTAVAAASDLSTTSSFFSSSSSESSSDVATDPLLSPPDFAALFASHRFFFPSPGHSNSIAHPNPGHNQDPNPDPNRNLDPFVVGGVVFDKESQPDLDCRHPNLAKQVFRIQPQGGVHTGLDPNTNRNPDPLVDGGVRPDPVFDPGPNLDADPLVAGGVAVDTDSPDPYWDFRRSMQEMVESRQLFDVKADWDYLHELLLCYLSLNPKHTHEFIFGAFSDLLVSLMSSSSTGSCRRKPGSHRGAAVSRQL